MNVIAYDLSLSATGYDTGHGPGVLHTATRGVDRLAWYREQIVEACVSLQPDLVIIEDYAYSRAAAHAHQLGELGGVIRLAIHDLGVPLIEIGPSALKRFLTGKGNANKIAMAMAAERSGYKGPQDDNAIDAWALRQMACYRYAPTGLAITAYRDDAVSKVNWPRIEATA